MMAEQLDSYDLRLLDELQSKSNISLVELAALVNLSSSQCSRRISRLKSIGYIEKQVTLLNPSALGLDVEAFVTVSMEKHGNSNVEQFHSAVREMPFVLECHAITGEGDYLLKVIAPNSSTLTEFIMKDLMTLPGVSHVKTALALTSVKSTTVLPLK